MSYTIPLTPQELFALKDIRANEELVAVAIAGVIQISRSEGKSLDDLTAELLADDAVLDSYQRYWLSQIVSQAWDQL
jgi:hypothetical protein